MAAATKGIFPLWWRQHFLTCGFVDFPSALQMFLKEACRVNTADWKMRAARCQWLALTSWAQLNPSVNSVFSEGSETSLVKPHCKREHNFKCCFWQGVTFNLAESYRWPTSLPAPRPAEKRSGAKGWWEVVPCGKAAGLCWEPEPLQHGVSSGEHFGGTGDPGRGFHFVLKVFGFNASYRPVKGRQTSFPSCSLMRPSPWLLPFSNVLVHSVYTFFSCLVFSLELRKDSRVNQGVMRLGSEGPQNLESHPWLFFRQKSKYLWNICWMLNRCIDTCLYS